MTISVKIIADSINPVGSRLTTFLLTYPRFIHCFDRETEVLTELNGVRKFRPWPEVVNTNALVAAYNQIDKSLTFEKPSAWIENDFEGKLIKMQNERLSFCVTDQHRMFIGSRKKDYDKWEIIKARELLGEHTQKRFATSGFVNAPQVLGENMSKLLGFFVGDGTLPEQGQQAIFHLKKERKIKYLHGLLNLLKIKYEYRPYKDGTTNTVFDRFPLLSECYAADGQKQIPKTLLGSSPEDMLCFLHGLWFSDGSTDKEDLKVFNTSSPHVAHEISALAAMCGEHINTKGPYAQGMYKLTLCDEKQPILRRDKTPCKEVTYIGKVYCASVSTGLLLVRRDGIAHVSGNCEFMTHRVFSRNAASSRAIPVEKIIKEVTENPAMPVHWGAAQKGMQAFRELGEQDKQHAKTYWLSARDRAVEIAQRMLEVGLAKQVANRILEPWMHMTVLASATEVGNFFNLRVHKDAQPEFQELARQMLEAHLESTPKELKWGQWHIPFSGDQGDDILDQSEKLKVCTARCARTSYRNFEGKIDIEKDCAMHDKLAESGHWSPFEHCAQAVEEYFDGSPDLPRSFARCFRNSNFDPSWKQYRKFFQRENRETFYAAELIRNVQKPDPAQQS